MLRHLFRCAAFAGSCHRSATAGLLRTISSLVHFVLIRFCRKYEGPWQPPNPESSFCENLTFGIQAASFFRENHELTSVAKPSTSIHGFPGARGPLGSPNLGLRKLLNYVVWLPWALLIKVSVGGGQQDPTWPTTRAEAPSSSWRRACGQLRAHDP